MDVHQNQNPSQERRNQNQSQNLPHPPPQACPRCNSNNTKFCYYNNYNLAQPRYFCKGCRRYWTHGGTLRNVPVGGGSRKRKRPSNNNNNNNKVPTSSANVSTTTTSIINRQPYYEQNSNGIGHTQNPSTNLLGTPIATGTFYGGGGDGGGGGGGFLSGVNFGPNLGLLQGLGLANLDHQQQQEPMTFQQLLEHHHHQNFHPGIGLSAPSSSLSVDWILNSNNNDNNNNNNNRNNNEQNHEWSDFQGNTGLQDP